MSRKEDIEKLIAQHQRRLQKLKEKQASYGIDTPVYILTEIEDTEAKIIQFQEDLKEVDRQTDNVKSEIQRSLPTKTRSGQDKTILVILLAIPFSFVYLALISSFADSTNQLLIGYVSLAVCRRSQVLQTKIL